METRFVDNAQAGRFEIHADGELAGAAYYERDGGAIAFTHTEIGNAYEGRGLGSQLARAALDAVGERGWPVLPHCPFIRGYIERHPEYIHLVPEEARGRFGL